MNIIKVKKGYFSREDIHGYCRCKCGFLFRFEDTPHILNLKQELQNSVYRTKKRNLFNYLGATAFGIVPNDYDNGDYGYMWFFLSDLLPSEDELYKDVKTHYPVLKIEAQTCYWTVLQELFFAMNQKNLARRLGISEDVLKRANTLTTVPEKIQELVMSGSISPSVAFELMAKLSRLNFLQGNKTQRNYLNKSE